MRGGGGGLGSVVLDGGGGALTRLNRPEPEVLLDGLGGLATLGVLCKLVSPEPPDGLGPSNAGPKSKFSSPMPLDELSRIVAPSKPEEPEEPDEACCGVGNGMTRPALAAAVCCWRAASSCWRAASIKSSCHE